MATPEQTIKLLNRLFTPHSDPGVTRNNAQEDPGKEMWTKYMDVFSEYDKRISDTWKEDAGGLLVFTGLFSATVGAFIIESYKYLSPNSGDQTVVLLGQISQQLAGFNGTFPNLPTTQPPSPSTPMIIVNAMWLMSLVLSIASALFATLLQQWARRYTQMPQIPSLASHRARVRSYLFLGTLKYKMDLAVETVPTLLHLSVFLFFIGLVIFFFTVNKAVAITVSVSVGVFTGIYFALSILPFFGHDCPYRTPISTLWWYPWHASLSFGALCLRWVMKRLHPDQDVTSVASRLTTWSNICEVAIEKHQDLLEKGFGKSVIKAALNAPVNVEREEISRLLGQLALADKSKLPDFVASIPKGEIVRLMTPPIESGRIIFHESLVLILNCAVHTDAAGLDVEVRKRCVMVGFEAASHVLKAILKAIADPNGVPLPEIWNVLRDIRTNFANIGHMRTMWADNDAAVRVTARSICALLARCLLRKHPLEQEDLSWLLEVIGVSSNEIYNLSGDLALLDDINLKSFVHGIFFHQEGDEDFPIEHIASFTETLAILMGAGIEAPFDRAIFNQGFPGLMNSMQRDGPQGALVGTELRHMFLDFLPPPAALPIPSPLPGPVPTPHRYPD